MRERTVVLAMLLAMASAVPAGAQTEYQFEMLADHDGGGELYGLLQASDGYFYGTAAFNDDGGAYWVFRSDASGRVERLARLDAPWPVMTLAEGPNGALYGAELFGPTRLFKVTKQGILTYVAPLTADAALLGPLHNHTDGKMYGVLGDGYVFSVDPSNDAVSWLSDFAATPFSLPGALTAGPDGWLYGQAVTCKSGQTCRGGVYRFNPSTLALEPVWLSTTYDGSLYGTLTAGPNGLLYGTNVGEPPDRKGQIFSVDPVSGQQAVVHNFSGGAGGALPWNLGRGLVAHPDGWLYGVTSGLGDDASVVFRVSPTGDYQVLHTFAGTTAGGSLTLARDGNIYGVTNGFDLFRLARVNTPASPGIATTVAPTDTITGAEPLTVTFTSGTTTSGATTLQTVAPADSPIAPPTGFRLIGNYYEIRTTATLAGTPPQIQVCISDPTAKVTGSTKLYHYETRADVADWYDITTTVDVPGNVICGTSQSLSPFALVEPVYTATVQPPIDADGGSVFRQRGSVPVKFTLAASGSPTCELPAATIAVVRTAGAVVGDVTEADYLTPSDDGSLFRISDCQYVYHLNGTSIGPGTYSLRIAINGGTVGNATFGIK